MLTLPKHNRYDYSVIGERQDYSWPGGKRLAFCATTNIEVYAYRKGTGWDPAKKGEPQQQRNYSWRDYGNRVGIWRLLELFDELKLPAAHNTNTLVYDYAARMGARRVYAIIGRDGQRPIVSSPSPRAWGRQQRHVPLYTIGVDAAKALLMSRLMVDEPGPGYVHIPHADWADEELAAQLTSERLVTVWHKGVPKTEWRKTRARNDCLDAYVYALSALRLLHPDLAGLARRLTPSATTESATPAPAPPVKPRWIPPRQSGWLRGVREQARGRS